MAHLDRDILTTSEIEALMRACSSRSATGKRNRALIALAWRAGLRVSEILSLLPKDVDLDAATVTVQRGKGQKHRVVGLDSGTIALLRLWIEQRHKLGIHHSRPLICSLKGTQLDTSYVRHLLPRLARKAGVNKRVHCHGLRHAAALQLERDGASLTVIRDVLGHSSAQSTDVYLRRIGAGEAVAYASKREWNLAAPE